MVNVAGLYVTPGLVDIHFHAFASTMAPEYTGADCVRPDGFTFRSGVTTVVDAGSSGWRNFPEFKRDIIYLDAERVDAIASDLVRIPLATWSYTQEPATAAPHLGFIIEDVEPSPSVDGDRDRVDLYGALSMTVAALQSQQRQIDRLRAQVSELQSQERVCRASTSE